MPRLSRVTISGTTRAVDLYSRGGYPTFPHLRARDYGVMGNGYTDDQTSLTNAFAASATQGLPLFLHRGVYRHSGRLTVSGAVVFAASLGAAILRGSTVETHAIDMEGDGSELHNLVIEASSRYPRTSGRGGNGVYVNGAINFTIRNCHIQQVTGAGIMLENTPSYGLIRNCQVDATGADGIHTVEGAHHVEIAYNRTVETGDDAISIGSYDSPAGAVHDIEIHHNTCVGNFQSRALTMNGGGPNVVFHHNHVDGGTAGMTTCSALDFLNAQTNGVEFHSNTIRNINQRFQDTGTIGGGAVHLWNDQPGSDSALSFHDNQVYNPGLYGIYVGGTSPITATVSNNSFYMDAGLTLSVNDNTGTTAITQSGNTRALTSAYPGDLIPVSVGGVDAAYQYAP